MNKGIVMSVIISIAALGISGYNIFSNREQKVVFVNIKELFENFDLKKQMQAEFDKTVELRKGDLSQMKMSIEKSVNAGRIDSDTLNILKNMYDSKAMEYRQTNIALSEEMDLKIYKQLRIYLLQYMNDENVSLLVSQSEEDLNLICNGQNVTKSAIVYINKKYNDK